MRCSTSTANCILQQVKLAQRSAVPSLHSRKRHHAVLAAIGNGNGNGTPAAAEGEADAAFGACMSSPPCMDGLILITHDKASIQSLAAAGQCACSVSKCSSMLAVGSRCFVSRWH